GWRVNASNSTFNHSWPGSSTQRSPWASSPGRTNLPTSWASSPSIRAPAFRRHVPVAVHACRRTLEGSGSATADLARERSPSAVRAFLSVRDASAEETDVVGRVALVQKVPHVTTTKASAAWTLDANVDRY